MFFKHTPGVNYYLSGNTNTGKRVTVYPHSDKTGIGISK